MNSLGNIFKVTSFGESHGSYVGCVIEGCPSNIKIDIEKIQIAVDKRKTAQNDFASARKELDKVEIISGIFESKTLGSPIAILIKNNDAKHNDYDELKDVFRPSHADYTTQQKYQHRDHRGGGRSSIRITAPMVAAGEIAMQIIQQFYNIEILTFVHQIGNISMAKNSTIHKENIEQSAVKCPCEKTTNKILSLLEETKKEGDTLGGGISCIIKNMPVGIGEPLFGKLQAQLAHAMLSINTVKAFEYGSGFASAMMKGSEHNDEFEMIDNKVHTNTNHDGGIQGGISNGMDIHFSVFLKPISSIQTTQKTVNSNLENTDILIKGRHDVCAVPRATSIVQAYTQLVLVDLILQNKIFKL